MEENNKCECQDRFQISGDLCEHLVVAFEDLVQKPVSNEQDKIKSQPKKLWKTYDIGKKNILEVVNNPNKLKIIQDEKVFSKYVMEQTDKWEKFFTKNCMGVEYYQTSYKMETDDDGTTQSFIIMLRVSKLKKGDYYAWDLATNQLCAIGSGPYWTIHPFERIKENDINLCIIDGEIFLGIGGINAKNELMDCLFKMIMMDTDKLGESSGHLHPEGYRSRLVKILYNLWD